MAVATADESVLLEREESLSSLEQALAGVRANGEGRLVLLSGEAGVGKTALLRSFCEQLPGSVRILWGGCDPLFTPRPLGPLLALAEDGGAELTEVVSGTVLPHELVTALMRDLRAHPTTILVLEDVHWADEATLDVLKLLSRRIESAPALVVASCRDGEFAAAHPLGIVLGELASRRPAARIRLAPLSPGSVAELARPHGVDGDDLYRKTAGNPFFVVEALAARGVEIPDTLREAVLARAGRLSAPARSLLDVVAVSPPRAELWLLEALLGDRLDGLDDCLNCAMLIGTPTGVAFRHELARLAIDEAIPAGHRLHLHREVLRALTGPSVGKPDLARLAHHAEAAGDVEAVLRFAPAAAARASALGAHREAAAQYARALRFGAGLPPGERAHLLAGRSAACHLIDDYDEAIAALERALECHREVGDTLAEGDALRRLSDLHWCPGHTAECERYARDAVALLESVPPSLELAQAYVNMASVCESAAMAHEGIDWSERAVALAKRLGDPGVALLAGAVLAVCRGDYAGVEPYVERARQTEDAEYLAETYNMVIGTAVERHGHAVAEKYVDEAITYASDRGLELFRLYHLAYTARLRLEQGRWSEAADLAAAVLRIPRTSTTPRILSLVVLALVRARRGDPEVSALLDEAWTLAEPTNQLPRLGPVALARAEAAWLSGRAETIAEITDGAFRLASERESPWLRGELAVWRHRAGIRETKVDAAPEPCELELTGEYEAAAHAWTAVGCPYEAALVLAHHSDPELMRHSLTALTKLGATGTATVVARRLRARGVRNLPRGPYTRTRANPDGLTARELDVLTLLVEGLRNAQIAERLIVSPRTVDHHISAILRKLNAKTRNEASAEATRRGILDYADKTASSTA